MCTFMQFHTILSTRGLSAWFLAYTIFSVAMFQTFPVYILEPIKTGDRGRSRNEAVFGGPVLHTISKDEG